MRNPPIEQLLAKVENKLKYIQREIFVFFLMLPHNFVCNEKLSDLTQILNKVGRFVDSLFLNWNQIGIFFTILYM